MINGRRYLPNSRRQCFGCLFGSLELESSSVAVICLPLQLQQRALQRASYFSLETLDASGLEHLQILQNCGPICFRSLEKISGRIKRQLVSVSNYLCQQTSSRSCRSKGFSGKQKKNSPESFGLKLWLKCFPSYLWHFTL